MDVSNAILKSFCKICSRLYREEKGASAIEYVLIAAVVVGLLSTVSDQLSSSIGAVNTKLSSAVSTINSGG
ncbi:Flp family type IVb pilin [Photobacterium sp. TY1-4]|uniref:Flp family type IVb pilin n=1 Tax=Photobacterium sp. TY1-4 TaxID=2899122 RepID=UPI0021C0906C|nr:Flp family type IVb pilin [Photobacterium sp. TY1-4]UXI02183.1 hypothetical protein NH461_05230 [Photobacterium sp. TY1-4]